MVLKRIQQTIESRQLAGPENPVLLMVSGGSDSTALAYIACDLREQGVLGPLAILHVNHQLRGDDAVADAEFVRGLAEALELPFFLVEVNVGELARETGENVEAVARQERYAAAQEALESLCRHTACPLSEGRIFTAHTQDDRVEAFYMRSIVGTGPGGFRSMRYTNGAVARPCLDVSRRDLRDYLAQRERDIQAGLDKPLVRDAGGALWREDATNAHTDRFRSYVRHEMVSKAKDRNPQLLDVLTRTMNVIADEDDMLDTWAQKLLKEFITWENAEYYGAGCVLAPSFGTVEMPLQRRVVFEVLKCILGREVRVEYAAVDAVLAGFADGAPVSGYTNNIQGNLALSANKRGLRIEPMAIYRARRKGR